VNCLYGNIIDEMVALFLQKLDEIIEKFLYNISSAWWETTMSQWPNGLRSYPDERCKWGQIHSLDDWCKQLDCIRII